MAFAFPISLDVTGRRCVVVGGGPLAAEKVAALREAGADVVAVPPGGYDASVLDGTFVAIATGEDTTDGAAVYADAEERGVLVNVMDDIPHCQFAFPSIVRRGPLRLAISTEGRAPVLSRRLRLHLEDELPGSLGDLVEALGKAREAALPRTVPFPEWQRRWRAAVEDLHLLLALCETDRADEVRDRVLATVTREGA